MRAGSELGAWVHVRSFLLFVKVGTASLFLASWLCELVVILLMDREGAANHVC